MQMQNIGRALVVLVMTTGGLTQGCGTPRNEGGAGSRDAGPFQRPAADNPASGGNGGPADLGADAGSDPAEQSGMRDVIMVGNSVKGSVSFLDAHTFENLGSVDVIPDFEEVKDDIDADLVRSIAYPIVKQQQLLHHFEPAEGERFVDDMFVSPDGETLYVSRSNLGDVAAFDLTGPGHPQLWRTFADGVRADHATISPDGSRIVVSATLARKANVIDTETGEIVGSFPTGKYPHQNDYTEDGEHIYNGSIGNVGYEAVSYEDNEFKGPRWLVRVDADTLEVERQYVFDYGIRPTRFASNGRIAYMQLSYLNGVIKFDLRTGVELDRSEQPFSDFAMDTYASYNEFPHDSAHHGLALSGDESRLCDCGTVDNTVAIVTTDDMEVEHMVEVGNVPYWATTGPEGEYCFVSMSGDDAITVIDYDGGKKVKTVPVGDFPQRNRRGRVPQQVIANLSPSQG